jgi:hypothetical protein
MGHLHAISTADALGVHVTVLRWVAWAVRKTFVPGDMDLRLRPRPLRAGVMEVVFTRTGKE